MLYLTYLLGKPAEINIVDLWENTGPATGINNPASQNCSQENQTGCVYEDHLFAGRVIKAIRGSSSSSSSSSSDTDADTDTSTDTGGGLENDGGDGDGGAAIIEEELATTVATKKPFFIFWAPRIVHSPLQVPQRELDHFSFINKTARAYYHAMVYYIDEAIGKFMHRLLLGHYITFKKEFV